ncbi:glycosyltransferase [Thioflavicoccus mobilis 8321]|uniref:Glycosyltransferase n=1 Tax=Thioflavicoccus mobilis 8321 TaxID=765912 RepID=L0GSW8_9GAMM|nr:glycosyltransferase [Thioflavicoccus mobilis]AGA88897.1 glycosyltransferase [Thioflavicoccus mobilis 8321]
MKKKICYLAALDLACKRGVVEKVRSTIGALQEAGYAGQAVICEKGGLAGALILRKKLGEIDADLIILRSRGPFGLFLVDGLIRKRLRGTKIVIDIPTPIRNAILEVWGHRKNLVAGLVDILLLLLAHPWCDLPANRVIEYGEEHDWFLIGLRKKAVLVGNGVAVANVPIAHANAWKRSNPLTLIAVSALSFWHGYDRLIRGLGEYQANLAAGAPAVELLLVGDGPERERLEALAASLGLADSVHFLGYRVGEPLYDYYRQAHVAISAIGCHRKGLTVASPLKSREALAMGLPIVYAYKDPDLPDDLAFAQRIPADDSAVDISALVDWYARLRESDFDPRSLREFAARQLDFSRKIWPYTELLKTMA